MTNPPHRGSAVALLLAPGLLLLGDLVEASPSAHDTASELAAIAAHPGRATLSVAIGFLALVLAVPGFGAMAAPLRDHRPRVAATGLAMSVTGALALVALFGSAPVTVAMVHAGADRGQMIALTDHYESSVLVNVWVGLMLLGFTLGPVVLGIALWRDGWSPLVPGALVVGVALMVADAGRWPLALGYAATWLGLGVVAVGLLRGRASAAAGAASARNDTRSRIPAS